MSTLSPAANTSAFNSSPTFIPSTESNLNSLKYLLGASLDFVNFPNSGFVNLFSFTSLNPNWIAWYPSCSTVFICVTVHGPTSITVTGTTFPSSSKICVIPTFFPINVLLIFPPIG